MRDTRETFGTKIANHQLVKQKIAEMEADYQIAHLLWLRAGYLKNEGKPNAPRDEFGEVAGDHAQRKSSLNGDRSSRREWLFKRLPGRALLRNCKAAIIYEGTRDIHTLMQADWALGLKKEKPARKTLPAWKQ